MHRLSRTTLIAVVMVACGGPIGGPATSPTTAAVTPTTMPDPGVALAEAARKWGASGLITYHFVFEDDCGECMPAEPRVVAVEEGKPDTATDPTVDSLFDTIASALDTGSSVEVSYHPELGYPFDIWIDREARAHDGGTHWLIRDLTPGLPDPDASSSEHAAAVSRWAGAGYSDYRYDLVTHDIIEASFSEPHTVTVRDGQVVEVQSQGAGGGAEHILELTIEGVFSLIEEEKKAGSIVDVLYHAVDGHPVFVSVRPPHDTAPPTMVFSIHDLTPLP